MSLEDIREARKNIRKANRLRDISAAKDLEKVLTNDQKRQISHAKEKGASSWLTVLPIEEHGFFLNKGEFRDSLHVPQLVRQLATKKHPFLWHGKFVSSGHL